MQASSQFSRGSDLAAVAPVDTAQLQPDTYAWQVTTFGYGASALVYKWRNLCHGILLRCENEEELHRYRASVVGYTSDAGTEKKLADCAFARPVNLSELRSFSTQVLNFERYLHKGGQECSHYLFPYCLGMQGHLHMISNAVETAITRTRFWPAFEPGLVGLLGFLNSKDLRKRFLAVCCPLDRHGLFKSWSKQLVDWRWESIGHVCTQLVPLVPTLQAHFDLDKMSRGGEIASLNEIDTAVLKATSKLLSLPWLEAILESLRVIGTTCNSFMSYLEGCECHEDIWKLQVSHAKKMMIFKSRTGLCHCWRKGCRGSEMATGGVRLWCDRVSEASSDHLATCLAALSVDHRSAVLSVMANIRESLREEFEAKLEHWHHLPFSILGFLATDTNAGKDCARRARTEFRNGDPYKHHRVTRRFFCNPVISKQIDDFIDSPTSEL
jgi:hypothetical protein